jgi:kumamolisin
VRLRRREAIQSLEQFVNALGAQPPRDRQYLSREEFGARFGADPADIAKVEAFAHAYELTVTRVDPAACTVVLEGSVAAFGAAFGVKLRRMRLKQGIYRVRTGELRIPSDLQGIIVGVHGLDNRPVAHAQFRRRASGPARAQGRSRGKRRGQLQGKRAATGGRRALAATGASFTAPDIAGLYGFPTTLSGAGQCIALIELNDLDSSGRPNGAGYASSDLQTYFHKLGIAAPSVSAVGVDGGANLPGKTASDGEVVLDIEVAGAIARQASIAVYFAPNTTAGFIDAVKTAAHDAVRKPSVISISWGGPEDPDGDVATQFLDGLNQAIQAAAAMGVTVCVAAGDNGSADMASGWDGKPHADFPASSPYALACGGTHLQVARGQISAETVWNDGKGGGATGGGVSDYFPLPEFQSASGVPLSPLGKPGRGVPDVAGDADPNSGYQVFLDGKWQVFGGTSAVAPLMAALLALINQQLQQQYARTAGQINAQIYAPTAAGSFRDITVGNNDVDGNLNGEYSAGVGWDACSGLGVPVGTSLLALLTA